MSNYHYLGGGPLFGAQIRYLIKSPIFGPVAALSFSAAAWWIKDRDQFIGWSHTARVQNLNLVVCNSRFLILPHVHVPNLASHVLSICIKKLEYDWKQIYGFSPVLIETFVDREKFRGISYKAANWIFAGRTAGRGRQDKNMEYSLSQKDIYLFPLTCQWRKMLQKEPLDIIKPAVTERVPEDWAEEEFGHACLGDNRLNKRLLKIARDFYSDPSAQIPQACKGIANTKAAYRFFDNESIELNKILASHYEATIKRCRDHSIVLVPQDTTDLNYTCHPATEDLGPIGTKKQNIIGLIMHESLAFTTDGLPLGFLDVQCWARDGEKRRVGDDYKKMPIEEKESIKWIKSYRAVNEAQRKCPQSVFVSICDREGDIYDVFVEAGKETNKAKILVRAEKSRKRKSEGELIWEKVKVLSPEGIMEVQVPRRGKTPSRVAKLEIRFMSVELQVPEKRKYEGLPKIRVQVVHAMELASKEVNEPIEWLLLTNITVENFEGACEKVTWYARRWGIEMFHRTLKSGCKIEDRQLGNADRIESCLAIDLVVAWRIYYVTRLGREAPNLPCTVFFEDDEWKALVIFKTKNPLPPSNPPTMREAVRMVASLGGFLGRKGDGEPGTQTMWRGIQSLDLITETYRIFSKKEEILSSTDTYG